MKTMFKAIALIAMGLMLTNCKEVQFNADGSLGVQTLPPYSDTASIEYYYGGWFGLAPNWKADAILKRPVNGQAQLHLRQPNCQVDRAIPGSYFYELADLIDNANIEMISNVSPIEDVGQESLTVTNEGGGTSVYNMIIPGSSNAKSSILLIKNPSQIRALMNEILEAYGCSGEVDPPVSPVCNGDPSNCAGTN